MLYADFIAFAGLDALIFPVYVIELELHQLCLRVLHQDTVQHIRIVMVGKTDVPDLPLRFFPHHKFKPFLFLHRAIHGPPHGVEEIIIKIIYLAPHKLLVKNPFIVLRTFYHEYRHLSGDGKGIPGITLCHQLAKGFLAVPSMIDISRVEISKSLLHIPVDHGFCLVHVHA
jgi:hypothetical protein